MYFALFRSTIFGNARSSHRRCVVRRGVPRNFPKFTGNTFTRASFLIKLQTGLFYRTLLGDCFWNAFIRKYANESYFSKNVTVWCFNISSSNDKFFLCFHTQWEVFFRSKFHPGTKFYSFHPGMKLTCKHKFFHTGMRFRLGYM